MAELSNASGTVVLTIEKGGQPVSIPIEESLLADPEALEEFVVSLAEGA